MTKTVRAFKVGEDREDYAWALKLSIDERLNLATKLLHDLWQASHDAAFPVMNRNHIVYTVPFSNSNF